MIGHSCRIDSEKENEIADILFMPLEVDDAIRPLVSGVHPSVGLCLQSHSHERRYQD